MASDTKPKNRHITLKVLLGIFIAFLLLLGVFFAIDYSHYARDKSPYRTLFIPRLELALIDILSLTADRTDLTANVMIHNPLPFNLRADSLAYVVYIRGVEVMRSTYAKSLDIKRWDTTVIHLPVTAYNDKLLSTLTEADKEGLDSVEYEIKTNFGIQLFGHHSLHLDIKTKQPLVFIPTIKVTKVEYDHLKAEGVDLYISTLITNQNKIRLKAKNINFKVAVADDPYVKGSYPGVLDILDSGATTPMTLELHLSFKQIGKSIGPLIKHGKNTPYSFEATLELVSDMNAMKNSQVIIADKGDIHDIVKLAKDESKKADDKLRAQGIDPKEHKKEMKKERKEKKKEGEGVHFGKRHHDDNSNSTNTTK
jgi:LEA14-like dessication related protein